MDTGIGPKSNSNAIAKNSSEASIAVIQGLDLAAGIWPRDLTDRVIEFWQEQLSKYKPEHIRRAFEDHCGNEDFFPTPGQIKRKIGEYVADEAPTVGEIYRAQLK